MTKKRKVVFSIAATMVLIFTILITVLSPSSNTPEFQNLIVDLDWDNGDFNVNDPSHKEAVITYNDPAASKILLEFGNAGSGGPGDDREVKVLPTLEYIVKSDAHVLSPVDGRILSINWQPSTQDYEIFIVPNTLRIFSNWVISIDHVLPIEDKFPFKRFSRIRAGDVLGHPGSWDDERKEGRVELMINESESGPIPGASTHHCPLNPLFWPNETLRQKHIDQLQIFMTNWETLVDAPTYTNDPYHGDAFVVPGCREWAYSSDDPRV